MDWITRPNRRILPKMTTIWYPMNILTLLHPIPIHNQPQQYRSTLQTMEATGGVPACRGVSNEVESIALCVEA
jgi:hypothetical protein